MTFFPRLDFAGLAFQRERGRGKKERKKAREKIS